MAEPTKVPCTWCSVPTAMTGTKMCDGCWELSGRIARNPELAQRMLDALKKKAGD